jgi:hypothetical protein
MYLKCQVVPQQPHAWEVNLSLDFLPYKMQKLPSISKVPEKIKVDGG